MTADQMPITADATIRPAVLLFTMGLALLTTLVFGLLAGRGGRWQASHVVEGRQHARDDWAQDGQAPRGLVIAETAFAVVLVIGASLLAGQLHARDAR